MPINKINIKDFVLKLDKTFLFDVRSPSEYNHAHIPGAKLLSIFSDDERKIVGTLYKQESREKAIKIGLEFFGKKTVQLLMKLRKRRRRCASWQRLAAILLPNATR
jgi:tRNA 2-selenouridine synthase